MLLLILCLVFTDSAYSQVIFQENFDGPVSSDLGDSANNPWITAFARAGGGPDNGAASVFRADGSIDKVANGSAAQNDAGALLAIPGGGLVANRFYTLSATFNNNNANWSALGFASDDTVLDGTTGRHSDTSGVFGGYAWTLTSNRNGNDQQIFGGIGTNDSFVSGDIVDPTQDVTIKVVLDTFENAFTDIRFVGLSSDGGSLANNPNPSRVENFTFSVSLDSPSAVTAPLSVSLANDDVVDTQALLFPMFNGFASGGGLFGRSPNSVAHQSSPLVTFGNYQYAAWYRLGVADEDIILGRRSVLNNLSAWESFDTGLDLIRGDAFDNDRQFGPTQTQPWDNHNAINIGISGDGRIHMAYDHHSNILRYIQGNVNVNDWDRLSVFGTASAAVVRNEVEQDSFIDSDPLLEAVTYPRFATNPVSGDLVVTYRLGQSGSGNLHIANYDASTGTWSAGREFITGNDGVAFNDSSVTGISATSTSRNPYLNNINFGPDGSLHASFTWRETANGTANHNLNYISSDDGGFSWLNDSGGLVAGFDETVSILSGGIIIGSQADYITPFVAGGSSTNIAEPLGLIDRRQTLINQQGQTVDAEGGVHILMWSREDESTYDSGDFAFDSSEAAYFHYYRDPVTGDWSRNQIPGVDQDGNRVDVGSRGQIGIDSNGNAFAAFASPGIANPNDSRNYLENGSLVIAGASRVGNYQDWTILYHDTSTVFEGEPHIDQERLRRDGVLSVFLQETSSNNSVTGSNMHVLDFDAVFLATLGDVNLDGVVDFFDISPFIALLTAEEYQLEGDMDQNGVVNFFDISPFIAVLSGN